MQLSGTGDAHRGGTSAEEKNRRVGRTRDPAVQQGGGLGGGLGGRAYSPMLGPALQPHPPSRPAGTCGPKCILRGSSMALNTSGWTPIVCAARKVTSARPTRTWRQRVSLTVEHNHDPNPTPPRLWVGLFELTTRFAGWRTGTSGHVEPRSDPALLPLVRWGRSEAKTAIKRQ